jgi:hypothetical protein
MSSGKTSQKLFFASIFIIPSLLCLGFYYFAIREPISKGKRNIFVKLPHYGPASVVNGDSVFYKIPEIELSNSQGERLLAAAIENKMVIYNCADPHQKQSIQLASQLYRIQDKLSYLKKDLKIITIGGCIRSQNLSEFREKVHADARIWDMAALSPMMAQQIFTRNLLVSQDDIVNNGDTSIYCNTLVLVDRNKQIRGYYKAITVKEADRLIDEAVVLAAEYGKFKQMK